MIKITLQDCLEGMAEMGEGSVEVIVTSPPYNLGIGYNKYDDSAPRGKYLEWIGKWCGAARRVLADDGSIFFNVGGKPKDQWIPFETALRFREAGFALQNVIHWIKAISIDREAAGKAHGLRESLSFGHYKPINSRRFLNDAHEYIFHFTKRGDVEIDRLALGVPYQDKSNVARWRREARDLRCRGNSWFIPYETIQFRDRDRPHPAAFPPRLPEMCIRLHGPERIRTVLDPFMGLGSTALACIDLDVSFIGFEIDEAYYETALRMVKERLTTKPQKRAGVENEEPPQSGRLL
jgi:site-specific DNA-methyltransferase (adenine-specific)